MVTALGSKENDFPDSETINGSMFQQELNDLYKIVRRAKLSNDWIQKCLEKVRKGGKGRGAKEKETEGSEADGKGNNGR